MDGADRHRHRHLLHQRPRKQQRRCLNQVERLPHPELEEIRGNRLVAGDGNTRADHGFLPLDVNEEAGRDHPSISRRRRGELPLEFAGSPDIVIVEEGDDVPTRRFDAEVFRKAGADSASGSHRLDGPRMRKIRIAIRVQHHDDFHRRRRLCQRRFNSRPQTVPADGRDDDTDRRLSGHGTLSWAVSLSLSRATAIIAKIIALMGNSCTLGQRSQAASVVAMTK